MREGIRLTTICSLVDQGVEVAVAVGVGSLAEAVGEGVGAVDCRRVLQRLPSFRMRAVGNISRSLVSVENVPK